jgi:hypothetical protein
MTGEAENTSWLDGPVAAPAREDDTSWLDVQDPNAGKTTLAFRSLIDACMRGTDRVMACDGHYLAYRPYNHVFDKATNPATKERFANFQAAGYYKHLGTYDEVQIYELLEGSPFRHSANYVVGKDRWKDIRQAATLACERKWADYHDLIGGMATALKSGRDPAFAKQMFLDALNQIGITIKQMGGPNEREVNEGFTGVRKARGISKGGVVATLDTSGLQQAQFK